MGSPKFYVSWAQCMCVYSNLEEKGMGGRERKGTEIEQREREREREREQRENEQRTERKCMCV